SCEARLQSAAQPGRPIKCPKCGTVFEVPEDEADAEPPSRPVTSRPKADKNQHAAKRKPIQSEKEERSQRPEQENAPQERPRKSKRRSKRVATRSGLFWAMIGGGVLGLSLAVVAALALMGVVSRKPPPQPPPPPAAPSDPLSALVAQHGGKIDRKGAEIVGVELIGAKISDLDLHLLKDVKSLRQLRLDNTAITDAGLESLEQLS